jgi:hypothetical protein
MYDSQKIKITTAQKSHLNTEANRVTNSSLRKIKFLFLFFFLFLNQSMDGPGSFKPVVNTIPQLLHAQPPTLPWVGRLKSKCTILFQRSPGPPVTTLLSEMGQFSREKISNFNFKASLRLNIWSPSPYLAYHPGCGIHSVDGQFMATNRVATDQKIAKDLYRHIKLLTLTSK